jgi:hypothetical protein
MVGRTLGGRYRVLRPVGRGGVGQVYEVEDVSTGERRAAKVLDREWARDEVVAGSTSCGCWTAARRTGARTS